MGAVVTLLQSGRALLKAVGAAQRDLVVEVLAPTMVSNPHFPGEETPSWETPTVTATVGGNLQPVREDTATRMGLSARTDVRELFTDVTTLDPEGRVRISNQQWRVMEVQHYATHTEAVVERLSNG